MISDKLNVITKLSDTLGCWGQSSGVSRSIQDIESYTRNEIHLVQANHFLVQSECYRFYVQLS